MYGTMHFLENLWEKNHQKSPVHERVDPQSKFSNSLTYQKVRQQIAYYKKFHFLMVIESNQINEML